MAEIYIKFIELIDLCKKMIELILLTSIATTPLPLPNSVITPVSSPVTAPSPKPTFTPTPVVTPTPAPPQAQQQEPPKESWAEKMWKRYTQNKGEQ
jgi:hypothetical protein